MSFIIVLLILCPVILLLNRLLDRFMVQPFVANHRGQTLHIGTDGIYWHKDAIYSENE
jgi:hypothetical protein